LQTCRGGGWSDWIAMGSCWSLWVSWFQAVLCEHSLIWQVSNMECGGKKCNLIQAVKRVRPQKGHCEKRYEIQSGGQEMAVMVG